jgi:hypothetical protein
MSRTARPLPAACLLLLTLIAHDPLHADPGVGSAPAGGSGLPARADLVITAVSDPPPATTAGGRFAITDTVTNGGGAPAGRSRVRHYLSASGALGGGEVRLRGSRLVPALKPGKQSTATGAFTVPRDTPAGTYRLLACADAGRSVSCLASAGTITVAVPDLKLTSITGPARLQRGQTADVTDTAENASPVATRPATTRYFLTPHRQWTVNARALGGQRSVPALAPGTASTGSARLALPASLAPGTYYLMGCIDPGTARGDAADNNCLVGTQELTVE